MSVPYVILGVNASAQDGGDIQAFIEELGLTFPILLDQNNQAYQDYAVQGLSVTVFVNSQGEIHEVFRGLLTRGYIRQKLTEL